MPTHILYLEDSEICYDVAKLMFDELGDFQITRAISLSECKKLLSSSDTAHYSLVLLDIMLPDGDSSVLLPDLKSRVKCPIVAFTAQNNGADIARLENCGFDAILPKPLSFASFKSLLDEYSLPLQ